MQFIAGLLQFYGLNLGAWAGFIAGGAYFLGYVSEAEAFFRENRALTVALLLIHLALCTIIYHARWTKRFARHHISGLRNDRNGDDF